MKFAISIVLILILKVLIQAAYAARETKITADDAAEQDRFGFSVSIDGNYAIVGAFGNDDNGQESGSAYIFVRDGNDWTQQAKLTADDAAEGDGFGRRVSISGDYSIVGASGSDDEGENSGSAYIYEHNKQTVSFQVGWNLMSINVSPPQEFYREGDDRGPDVVRMMEQLRVDEDNHLLFMIKNEAGRFYVPRIPFNNIPYWNLTEGYQVRVLEDCEATWAGEQIPADADIPIGAGWNMIAYFPTYDLPMTSPDFYAIEPILDHVVMIKNNQGRFARPGIPFSNMQPLTPGQGYQIRVDEDVVLNYPEELLEEHPPLIPPYFAVGEARTLIPSYFAVGEDPPLIPPYFAVGEARTLIPPYFAVGEEPPLSPPLLRRGGEDRTLIPPNPPYKRGEKQSTPPLRSRGGIKGGVLPAPVNTGHNMSVLVTSVSGYNAETGDQVAAFSSDGQLVGVGNFNTDGMCGIAVWGDDESTDEKDGLLEGESFELRLSGSNLTQALIYHTDDFIALDLTLEATLPTFYYLDNAFPNPFNSITRLSYGLPEPGLINISVYDIAGRQIATLVNQEVTAGIHSVIWDASNLSSGIYFARMKAGNYSGVKKIILVK